ncbi:hypothetical protein CONLIGDRAFT_469165 [Coniochaeta ligniaria NRRL 30616]|uniref:Uncharacterized protein n=1 Tax=Coniochaeta ligniaria NRRL 30616 TaxID=1408157 RepID=A0A1J7IFW9_9PEZI|nr:hypothetical protein CONLIGDRAFT_469165 [Coniochaeta ligniaria NRRL 30616]
MRVSAMLRLVSGLRPLSNFPNILVKLWSADSVSPSPQHSFAYWISIYALPGVCVVLCVFPAGVMLHTAVDLHQAKVGSMRPVEHASFLIAPDPGHSRRPRLGSLRLQMSHTPHFQK